MFVVLLRYIKPLEEIDQVLEGHVQYLDKYYRESKFICSGRRNPRIGGVILVKANSEQEVQKIIAEDPFYINKAAEYEIIEFKPSKYHEGFASFIDTK